MVLPVEGVRGAAVVRSLPRLLSRSRLSDRRSRKELPLAGELPRPKPPGDGSMARLAPGEWALQETACPAAARPRRDEELDRWAMVGRSREGEDRLPVPSSRDNRDCFLDSGLWPGLVVVGGDPKGTVGVWGTPPCFSFTTGRFG